MSGTTGQKSLLLGQSKRFAGILLGTEKAPRADEEIDKKKVDGSYELTEAERKEKKNSGKQIIMHT